MMSTAVMPSEQSVATAVMAGSVVSPAEYVSDCVANAVATVVATVVHGCVMHGRVVASVVNGCDVVHRGSHVHAWNGVAGGGRVHRRGLHGVASRRRLVVAWGRHLALGDRVALRGHLGVALRRNTAWVTGLLH
jgi:hypothetical protein